MTQIQTLRAILQTQNAIYEKLCQIEEKLDGGGGTISIDVPPFFDANGSLILDGVIQAEGGGTQEDQVFTDRLTQVFQQVLAAVDNYAENPDEEWEELP